MGGAGRAADGVLARLEESAALLRAARVLFVLFVFGTFAAISLNGFYQKWGFRDGDGAWDGDVRYSFVSMIEGEAHKPFVYRQLLPKTANAFEAATPEPVKEWLLERMRGEGWWEVHNLVEQLRLDPALHDDYLLRYEFIYYASFLFMFGALFVLREVAREMGTGEPAATIAPCLFSIVFVYAMSMGGFFYDFPEVFFLALAALLAMRGRWGWLVPVTALATFNKEVFVAFVPMLFPFLRARMTTTQTLAVTGGLIAVAAAVYLGARLEYADNPGGTESWLKESIKFYADVRNLIAFEVNFGMETPRAYSLPTFVLLALLVIFGWRRMPATMQQHGVLAFVLNTVLVLLFCGPGEMRNFSLCFIALFALIAQNLANWTRANTAGVGAIASRPAGST